MSRRINANLVETDHWQFEWAGNGMNIRPLPNAPCQHRYSIQGDPHFYQDDRIMFDFPDANCTFIFTDGTVLVAQAPVSNQALRDCHIFATDGQYYTLGQTEGFSEAAGWLFVQQDGGCEFFCTSMKPITNNAGQQQIPARYSKA